MDSQFHKYPHIENSYREKYIENWVKYNPDLEICKYGIQEKIDGTNIRVYITKEDIIFGTRRTVLTDDQDHMGLRQLLHDNTEFEECFRHIQQNFIKPYHQYESEHFPETSVTLFGELYGKGILNRIPYGDKWIRFYDVAFDGKLQSPWVFEALSGSYLNENMSIPFIKKVEGLENVLTEPKVLPSIFAHGHDAEGVVIKPYFKIYEFEGDIFYLKHKNPEFKDMKPKKKKKKKLTPPSPFKSYVTENRVLDMFSKEGPIQSKKEIGKYIRLILDDIKQDWLRDHAELPKNTDVGGDIAKILLKLM